MKRNGINEGHKEKAKVIKKTSDQCPPFFLPISDIFIEYNKFYKRLYEIDSSQIFSTDTFQIYFQDSLLNSPNHCNHMNQADKDLTMKSIAKELQTQATQINERNYNSCSKKKIHPVVITGDQHPKELKILLMKVKGRVKAGLKLNSHKTKIMASSPITS